MAHRRPRKPLSTTQRTTKWLDGLGLRVGPVTYHVPQAKRSYDLFGFADLLAVDFVKKGSIFIQCTTDNHRIDHREKMGGECEKAILGCLWANRVWLVTWPRRSQIRPGKKQTPKIEIFTTTPWHEFKMDIECKWESESLYSFQVSTQILEQQLAARRYNEYELISETAKGGTK